ncbi:unnamed protein product [Clonostachys rhizophaga]|uniref:Major facilitator superfamily (MFS) profile domain-containing protein n=1 Tax=Clonostachys rhizophaga TaxID=160324 RepID=A0A9N9V416_9HYPO|nr:unnamed protein product [Clonostachys rhizophaga]
MSFVDKIKASVKGTDAVAPAPAPVDVAEITPTAEKTTGTSTVVPEDPEKLKDDVVPDESAQNGVRGIQAATLTWDKSGLAAMLCLIWLLFLTNGFRLAILASLTPYVTSQWSSHSLLTVITIVSNSMSGAVYIPMAKMLDVWGRAEAFLLMVGSCVLGLILMAVADNLATFCAARVFYSVGFGGLIYSIVVLASDVTNLQNRGLAFAFTSSPYMITAFAGSKAAEKFLQNVSIKWGFGAFAIIMPFVTLPTFILLKYHIRKAEKNGIIVRESSGRTLGQNVWHYIIEFDALGVFLFAVGLVVFLLPFTLAASAPKGWKSGYIIAMIVVGFFVLVLFGVYEILWAPAPFLKNKFLTDRSVIGTCLQDATYQISYYCWNSYFTSFLQVVCNLTVAEAGYVNSTFQVVSGVLLFGVGYLIRRTGRFKWLYFGAIPLYIFAQGLMIHFRRPNEKIGYIVMCEIFISISGSIFVLCQQLSVLAAVDHQHVAAVLALLFVSASIGGAIGSTISGAIWTNTFLPALLRNLPESAVANATTIYASLPAQLSYPVGSLERIAIQEAYGYAQTRMLAAGTGIMVLCFIWVWMIKNFNVKEMTQTKGMVF